MVYQICQWCSYSSKKKTCKCTSYYNNNVNISNYKHSTNLLDYYQNVRSLNNKLRHLMCNIPCNNYDFLIFSETWLNYNVLYSELSIYYYKIFRCNRSRFTKKFNRDGGSIGIKNNYVSEIIKISFNSLKQVFVLIKINNKIILIIGACYIPEVSLISVYETHVIQVIG